MAAEYLANAVQTIESGSPAIFTASIPCTRGYVYHEDETGIFILRGITCGQAFATYQLTFNGNVALPTGAVAPISVAIAVNGEERPTSEAIYTPTAVDAYGNVTSTAIVKVPKGCCFSVSVRNTSDDAILMQNANFVVNRIA